MKFNLSAINTTNIKTMTVDDLPSATIEPPAAQ